MRMTGGTARASAGAGAALLCATALAAPDFASILKPTQEGFGHLKTVGRDGFKTGVFPRQATLDELWTTEQTLVKTFVDGCPLWGKIAFSDASHYADVKTLKEWTLTTTQPDAAVLPPNAAGRFYATWSKAGSGAPDVCISICDLPQKTYAAGKIKEPSTKFPELGRQVPNSDVAGVLQALADDWARTRTGAAAAKPTKKSAGVAKWFASAAVKATDPDGALRRTWYAWETSGVSATVEGTTWVATVVLSSAAAGDAKTAAKAEEVLKNLAVVVP